MLILNELSYAPRDVGPISLSLEPGQLVLICGPSGSGKSTLCAMLCGELEPTSGHFQLPEGALGTISVDAEGQLLGSTVSQELELGRIAGVREQAREFQPLLERWKGRGEVDPQSLSAGEQQLLLLAGLALGPFNTLILDEALSSLDESSFREVVAALRVLSSRGVLILVVSHEIRLLPWVDRCVGISRGRLAFNQPSDSLTWSELGESRMWMGGLAPPADPSSSALEARVLQTCLPDMRLGAGRGSAPEVLAWHRDGLQVGLARGQALAVAGVSGSGKSRLLAALAGLTRADGWSCLFEGYRVLLPQVAASIFWRRTVRAELEASLGHHRIPSDLFAVPESWLERSPRSLSHGQTRLVASFCLLLQKPDLLLLDQPFSGLDGELRAALESRLRDHLADGGRLVFTTHRPDEMVLYPDRLLVLDDGNPVWYGPGDSYFAGEPDPRLGLPGLEGRPKTPLWDDC